ncbi:DUF982 domain-containing protein [Mesorhizobium sp. CCNWLW176]|uniref:DUF982 domain-containing protein n=1 Tax=unclassified Mesorhizobium TaxID=325217 RepID=UPI003FA52E52
MTRAKFASPIDVDDGPHLIGEIHCLEEALDFPEDWPRWGRGPIDRTAVSACTAARLGRMSIDSACGAFKSFARATSILRETQPTITWWQPPNQHRSGA